MLVDGAMLFLSEEEEGRFSTVLFRADRQTEHLPAVTPAEDLLAAVEVDCQDYRREIKRLREEHPLFESGIDISVEDFEDLVTEVLLLPSLIQERDPVGYFVLVELLHRSLCGEDDGTASFLLNAAARLLQVLEEPLRVQAFLRNIFEMTFDGAERFSQQERFEKLRAIYPHVAQCCNPALLDGTPAGGRVFAASSLFSLRLLELALYFRQDRQRIARCDYCWGYFIPKTKKVTRYCDRVTDGFPCKQRGSRMKRNLIEEQDGALLLCSQLRDRMYARYQRYMDAAPTARNNLFPMDYERYDAWSENARLARMDYLAGKLSAGDFLRRIDTTHELTSYEASKAELTEESAWQRRVAGNPSFDPERHYPEAMMSLNLGAAEPKWEHFTADDLRRKDQEGHQSLRERYGKR